MQPNYEEIKKIFLQARGIISPSLQLEYLQDACGTNAELFKLLKDMLQGVLEPTLAPTTATHQKATDFELHESLEPGVIISEKYKILERIGQGGMGTVYRARRVNDLKIDVALKVVSPGMDSRQVLARFKIEQQALALMNHPNIAKVIDAGLTQLGHPYFVMELVKGLPITKFCDQNKLTVSERINLFRDVCAAVQHAHHKGIVHRDLKPSNILVGLYDEKAVVKVIDFGLAKALNQPLTDDSVHTRLGMFVGTWQYTAPEQALLNNLDIDTRADIYSLGVILYELLTGQTPIDKRRFDKAAQEELIRIFREEEPQKPSTKLHSSQQLPTIAAMRRAEPVLLEKEIRGDLDWIVMKALDKDRNRRYASAQELAYELDRFLRHEPVMAGPPTWRYRLRKFTQRHRGVLTLTGLLSVVVILAAIISTVGWITATKERNRANRQTEIARAVIGFLNEDLLSEVDPSARINVQQPFISNITVKKALDRAALRVGNRFAQQPLIEASIRFTIGRTYSNLGDFPQATLHLEKAEALFHQNLGPLNPERLDALHELALLNLQQSQFQKADQLLHEVLTLRIQVLGAEHADTCRSLFLEALRLSNQEKLDEANQLLKRVLAIQTRDLTMRHRDTLSTMRELADIANRKGELNQAESLLKETLQLQKETLGSEHPESLTTLNSLGLIYDQKQDYVQAEACFRDLLKQSVATFSPDHPTYLTFANNLAGVYCEVKKYKDAITIYDQIIPLLKQHAGPHQLITLAATQNKAAALIYLQQLDQAEPLLLEAYQGCCVTFGDSHENTRGVLENLIALYEAKNDTAKVDEFKKLLGQAKQKAKIK